MTETHVAPTALSESEAASGARSSRWNGGRVTALVIGGLLVLVSLVLLGAGGTALWADRTQRDGGYATTDAHDFSSEGSALATEPTDLGSAGVGWLYSPGLLDKIRIRVTPTSSSSRLFVGIGRSSDVDRYLSGVGHTVISDFWTDKVENVVGSGTPGPPVQQGFWSASTSGTGEQSLVWDPADGTWTVVVMNADGRAEVDVATDLGAKVPALPWIALGVLLTGAIFLTGGALLIAGALSHGRTPPPKGDVMASSITATVPRALVGREEAEALDRYQAVRQYSLAKVLGVWAAAAVPMGLLAWVVAPALEDNFSGTGNVPIFKAVVLLLTAGMAWQFVLTAILIWTEQRTFRWSVVREALWLRSPKSPKTGRVGGRLWLIVIPLILLFSLGAVLPTFGAPENRDFAMFLDSDAGQKFFSGAWGWFGVIVVMQVFNVVLGEELLFRGVLLPRMKRVFGRGDWAANGVLFAAYHVHMPWLMPGTLLFDTFAMAYPSKRFQSTWIAIAVHGSQSLFFGAILLTYVL